MNLSRFRKQRRGPRLFDSWKSKESCSSSLGDFFIELVVEMDAKPSGEMLQKAEELLALFRGHEAAIHDKVFEHYRIVVEAEWNADLDLGVPKGLDRAGIVPFVDDRVLDVSDSPNPEEPFRCRVSVRPAWDEEHGICLAHQAGVWEFDDY